RSSLITIILLKHFVEHQRYHLKLKSRKAWLLELLLGNPFRQGSPMPESFSQNCRVPAHQHPDPDDRRPTQHQQQLQQPQHQQQLQQQQPARNPPPANGLAPEKFEKVAMCIFDFEQSCPLQNAARKLEESLRGCKSAYELCHGSVTEVSPTDIRQSLDMLSKMKCIAWDQRTDTLSSIDVSKLENLHL
ncbi:hypothetical protein CYMTET_9697, partial [Cymbomonas tetramitiformis]